MQHRATYRPASPAAGVNRSPARDRGHDDLDVVERAFEEATVDRSERPDVELVGRGRREALFSRRLEVAVLDGDVVAEPEVHRPEQPAAPERRSGDHVLLSGVGHAPPAEQIEDDVLVLEGGRHSSSFRRVCVEA